MGRLAIDYIQYLCDLFQKERLVKQGWPMDKATQACFRPPVKFYLLLVYVLISIGSVQLELDV